MAEKSSPFHVLIIGGGNCGLAVATGLKKAGVSYTIFERSNEYDYYNKPRDWGMMLHWATEDFLKLLPEHLQHRIKEPRVDPSYEDNATVPHFDGATGELIGAVPTPVIHRLSRKKIRKFLTEDENLNIKFEKALQSMEVEGDKVIVDFEDGTKEVGNMVAGCDGSHSRVREYLVGSEAAKSFDTGLTFVNYAASNYTPDQAHLLRSVNPILSFAWHPDLSGGAMIAALDIPNPHDTTGWKFQLLSTWQGGPWAADLADPTVRMEYIRERLSKFCEPYRTAFLAKIDEGEIMPIWPGLQWAPTMTWDNHGGKVTIAGDAAHSMLAHRGQGLNNAIKDAADIVDGIKMAVSGSKPLEDAITAYEEEMRERGAKEVALSHEQALKSEAKFIRESMMLKAGYSKIAKEDGSK